MRSSVLFLILASTSCGNSKSSTAPPNGVFQIASVVANLVLTECATLPGSQYVTSYILHLVNTTPNDVIVSGVSSTGQVIRSTRPEEVGMVWNTFASLPFSPALVAAHDFLDMGVTLSSSCLPHPRITQDEFRDVYTALLVTTNTGAYSTPWITTTIRYKFTLGG